MEFKDKLKKLRNEKGISQQSLSESIFVSRSAVAKWENGLGYPCADSLDALSAYFDVPKDYWKTENSEEVIIEKNKKISKLGRIIKVTFLILLVLVYLVLMFDVFSDNYGFTSEIVAGTYADDPCIKTSDYNFYYYTFGDEGEENEYIANFYPVKKLLIGYAFYEEDKQCRYLYDNGEATGIIYSIEGKEGYYNFIRMKHVLNGSFSPYYLGIDTIETNGKTYDVTLNSFFITDEPVNRLHIGDVELIVGEVVE